MADFQALVKDFYDKARALDDQAVTKLTAELAGVKAELVSVKAELTGIKAKLATTEATIIDQDREYGLAQEQIESQTERMNEQTDELNEYDVKWAEIKKREAKQLNLKLGLQLSYDILRDKFIVVKTAANLFDEVMFRSYHYLIQSVLHRVSLASMIIIRSDLVFLYIILSQNEPVRTRGSIVVVENEGEGEQETPADKKKKKQEKRKHEDDDTKKKKKKASTEEEDEDEDDESDGEEEKESGNKPVSKRQKTSALDVAAQLKASTMASGRPVRDKKSNITMRELER